MKKKSSFFKVGLLCACLLCTGSVTPVLAAEEMEGEAVVNGGIVRVYQGKDVFKAEPLVVEQEAEMEIGNGNLTEESPEAEFEVTVPRTGNYCLKLEDINEECEVYCDIKDDYGNEVDYEYYKSGGRKAIFLEESISYKVRVKQSVGNTAFKCTFIPQQPTVDLSNLSHIQDKILFEDQTNIYTFTPKRDGYYTFNFAEKTSNARFYVKILDSYNVEIEEFSDYATIYMEKDMEYRIQIRQSEGLGQYTFVINQQKEKKDVTGYTQVDDAIQYTGQHVVYTFIPPVDGVYYVGPTNLRSEFSVRFYLLDKAADKTIMDSSTGGIYDSQLDNGVELTAGKEYQIEVVEVGDGEGDYSVYINYPTEAVDYLQDFTPEEEEETTEQEISEEDEQASEEMKNEMSQLQDQNQQMEDKLQEMQEKYDALMDMLEQNEIVSE